LLIKQFLQESGVLPVFHLCDGSIGGTRPKPSPKPGNTVLDETDKQLVDWVKSIAGREVGVTLDFPTAAPAKTTVSVYLMEVLTAPALRQVRDPEPLKLTLRYLVTTWASSPEEGHRVLGQLILAAMTAPQKEVEADAAPHSVWQSLGQPVRPSFFLRVPVLQARFAKPVPKVRQPIVLRHSPMRPFAGQVLGPGEIGIMNALIEVPSLHLTTRTDSHGRFQFAAVPTDPPIQLVRVHAKGRGIDVSLENQPASAQPLVIQLNESQL